MKQRFKEIKMSDKITTMHSKGQKHPGKTKWEKVIN